MRRALTGVMGDDGISSRTVAATMVHQLVSERGGEVITSDSEQPFIMFGARIPA